MLIIAVTFKIEAGQLAAFREAIRHNAATSLAVEADCLTFDVSESREGGTFFLYERYTDDAAFDLHLKSPHFLAFDQMVGPWIESKKVERFYELPALD